MADRRLVTIDCGGLDDGARDKLIAELWTHRITGIEERDGSLVVGFDDERDAMAVAHALGPIASVVPLANESYLDEWRAFAQPVRVGRLFVRPDWLDAPVPAGAVEIALDPRRAFGSGGHPSTVLALELLQRAGTGGRTVLDVGTGSGVLSLAAAALGASAVVALDVDPSAVQVALANCRRSGVDDRVQVVAGTVDALRGRFDIVVSNVLPSVHRTIAPAVRRLAERQVVVSGMLAGDAPAVEALYGRTVVERRTRDGWAAARVRIDHPQLGS